MRDQAASSLQIILAPDLFICERQWDGYVFTLNVCRFLCKYQKVIQLLYMVYFSSAQKCLIYRLCLQKSDNHIKLSLQMTIIFSDRVHEFFYNTR